MRELQGRQAEHGEANDVNRVEEPEQQQQQFRSDGRIPPVEQAADPGRSASASDLAFGEAEKKKPQQGEVGGSFGWDDAAALGAGLLGGPLGAAGAWAYEKSKSKDEPKATGPGADDKKPGEATSEKAPPPTMSHKVITENSDIPADRTTVGVGEDLVFTGSAAGKWSADGGVLGAKQGASTSWRAPSYGGTYNITLDVDGQPVTKQIEVIAPTAISYENQGDWTDIPKGTQGAGMDLGMHLEAPKGKPVSFKNVLVRENPGPATGAWGYFDRAGLKLAHDPTDGWTGMDDFNYSTKPDKAFFKGWDKVPDTNHWAEGGFTWMVPHMYTIKGEEGAKKLFGQPVPQVMKIHDKAGTSTVTKDKASTKPRKP